MKNQGLDVENPGKELEELHIMYDEQAQEIESLEYEEREYINRNNMLK